MCRVCAIDDKVFEMEMQASQQGLHSCFVHLLIMLLAAGLTYPWMLLLRQKNSSTKLINTVLMSSGLHWIFVSMNCYSVCWVIGTKSRPVLIAAWFGSGGFI